MPEIFILSGNIFFTLLLLSFCLLIGYLLSPNDFFEDFKELDILKRVFLGLFTLVTLFALFKSGFNTVYLGAGIALLYGWLFTNWKQKRVYRFSDFKVPFPLLIRIVLLVVFYSSVQFLFVYSTVTHRVEIPSNDYFYYSRLISTLSETGQENLNFFANKLRPDYNGVMFYHFFELWLSSLCSSVFKTNGFESLFLIVNPLFYAIIAQVFLFNLKGWRLIVLLLVLFSGLFPIIESTGALGEYAGVAGAMNLFYPFGQKYIYWVPCILLSLGCYFKGNYFESLFYLVLLVFISVTSTFVSLFLVAIGIVLLLIKNKKFSVDVLSVMVLGIIYFFTALLVKKPQLGNSVSKIEVVSQLKILLENTRTLLNIDIKSTLQYFLAFGAPILLIFCSGFLGKDTKAGSWRELVANKNSVVLFVLVLAMQLSLLVYVFFFNVIDAQFFFLSVYLFTWITLLFILVYSQIKWLNYVLYVYAAIGIYNVTVLLSNYHFRVNDVNVLQKVEVENALKRMAVNGGKRYIGICNQAKDYNSVYKVNSNFNIPYPFVSTYFAQHTDFVDLTLDRAITQGSSSGFGLYANSAQKILESSFLINYLGGNSGLDKINSEERATKKLELIKRLKMEVFYVPVSDLNLLSKNAYKLLYINKKDNKALVFIPGEMVEIAKPLWL